MTVHREDQIVELVRDAGGVPAGSRGCVVGVYGNGGYEVEVVDADGDTVAVVTVGEADLRAAE